MSSVSHFLVQFGPFFWSLVEAVSVYMFSNNVFASQGGKKKWISITQMSGQTVWVIEKPAKFCSCRTPGMDFLISLLEYFTEQQQSFQADEKNESSPNFFIIYAITKL